MVVAVALLVAPAPPPAPAAADAGGRLVTTWSGAGARLCLLGAVDVVIDWGDGTTETVQGFRDPDSGIRPIQHTFVTAAPTHRVTATGTFERFGCSNSVFAAERLTSVDEWGPTGTTHADFAVANAVNVGFVAEPPPTVTSMRGMFYGSSFNQPIGDWDVSRITDMSQMFLNAAKFNQNLSSWCVPKISFEPFQFDDGATAWVLPRPTWGICDGVDTVGPAVTIANLRQSDGLVLFEGFAGDTSGVARVLCAVQDRSTGLWLRRDRTWGAYERLRADLVTPGATRTKWRFGRRLPLGSYTLNVIGVDVPGNFTPPPRPSADFVALTSRQI